MQEQETVINQTLMIWVGIVIAEIFVIAHLMQFPGLLLAAFLMYWPARAALNWPAPVPEDESGPDAAENENDAQAS